jgi:hypothetical protein
MELISKWSILVHSLYLALINNGIVPTDTILWKVKVPLKIRFLCSICSKG